MPAYVFPGVSLALLVTGVLAWKWHLGVPRVAVAVVAISAAWAPLIAALDRSIHLAPGIGVALTWSLIVLTSALGLLYCFYRDPDRSPPPRDDVIISPADGEVVYVYRVRDGELPVAAKAGRNYPLEELTRTVLAQDEAYVIGISMSFLDVHVNRAPIPGRIAMTRHFAGSFGSLRRPEMVFRNERATTVIEGNGLQIAVVQIASRLVRRIVSFVSAGDDVDLGQRIGAIRFGSQVDVVVPARSDLQVAVRAGDRVQAGRSILATVPPAGRTGPVQDPTISSRSSGAR
jgi:phosphatidylserine decarboxylase